MAELIFVSIGFCVFALGIAMGIALAGYVVITGSEGDGINVYQRDREE